MKEIISIEKHSETVRILHLHDEKSKNTFTEEFVNTLMEKLTILQKDKTARAVVVKGFPDIFCAGADKEALMELFKGELEVKDLVLAEAMIQIPVPVIAAMEGGALGGGFVLGMYADIVIMSERSMYGVNFTNLGFSPGMGCTRLVQGLVGDYVANELMYTGKLLKGKTYAGRSNVNYVLPKDQVLPKALELAEIIAERPRLTLETVKYSVNLKKRQLLQEARVHEDFMHKITFNQPEVKGIIQEMYNQKYTVK